MWKAPELDFEQMVKNKMEGNHFMHDIGFQIHTIESGLIEGDLELKPRHLQQMGFVHGGVTATIADIVAGFAAFTLVKHGQGVVTVDLRISYLNPGKSDKLFAKGYVIKAGQKLFFCESELWTMNNDAKILIAKSSATMAVVNTEDIKR
jgi:uncharacterized protein (TIGR00369 family)